MFVFRFILFTLIFTVHNCKVPDKVYCATEKCDTPLSKAKTLLMYNGVEPNHLSFKGNSEAVVYMKSAGSNPELWYASINGKKGFVNKEFLREYKIITKNPEIIVPLEVRQKTAIVQPDKVQQPHEVFEGTTIYNAEATTESVTTPQFEDGSILESNSLVEEVHNSPIQEDKLKGNENVLINNESEKTVDIPQEAPIVEAADSVTNIINERASGLIASETLQASSEPLPTGSVSKTVDTLNNPEILTMESREEGIAKAQALLTSVTGNLNSGPTVGILDNKDLLQQSLNQPEQKVNNEQQNHSQFINDGTSESPLQIKNEEVIDEVNIEVPQENIPQPNVIPSAVETNEILINDPVPADPVPTHPSPLLTKTFPGLLMNNIQEVSSEKSLDIDHTSTTIEPSTTIRNMNADSIPINNINADSIPINNINADSIPINNINADSIPINNINADSIPINNVNADSIPISNINTDSIPINNINADSIPINNDKQPNQVSPQYELIHETSVNPSTVSADPIEYTSTTPSPTIYESYVDSVTTLTPTEEPTTSESPIVNQANPESTTSTNIEYSKKYDLNNQYAKESVQQSMNPEVEYTTEQAAQREESILPEEQNGGGFLSSMYTTVVDMWSMTEKPIIEEVFNNKPEDDTNTYTYESTPDQYYEEKPDSIETENGFSFLSYFMSSYNSVMGTNMDSKALFPSAGETCFTDEYCVSETGDNKSRFLTFLMTTATSVLLFTLGYYYLENRKQDSKLINNINGLQRDLLCSTKECEILKEELSTTKTKLAGIEDSSFGVDDMVVSLKDEINELKAQNDRLRNSLDDNEKLLKVSENTAGELQNTLSEVENTLSELWAERSNSEEQISELNGKIQAFEEELISVSRERDNFQLKYVSAESALEDIKKQVKNVEEMKQQLLDATNTIELQRHEIKALKEALKDLKSSGSEDVDVASLIDHTELKAKLNKAMEEKNLLSVKFDAELKDRVRLSEELKTAQEMLQTTSQQATEAVTRLEVLGKYFQDRESELLKELNAKETLWLSKQGESTSTVEKIELLQQELQRYKEKCDTLTRELAEQESSHRAAISDLETRAHTAWLEARAARRDADGAKEESATLRRKLAHNTSIASPTPKLPSGLELDGGLLPPPLPPPLFLPPPLLPPLPRPPPLGRLPSPRPARYSERRYSPDSRYSPESRYSPGSRHSPESRYSPETVRHTPDSRYSPRRRSPYTSPSLRRRSRDRYDGRGSRSRIPDTETEYNSDSPTRETRPSRRGYSRHSGPSSGSGCSSESDK